MSPEELFLLQKNSTDQKCPEGNTKSSGHSNQRVRWFPSFTSFLQTEPVWNPDKMKYLCYGKEICPTTKKEHWQGCVYFFDKVSIKQAQNLLGIGKSHMEFIMKTTYDECIEYCKKDGISKEFGSMPVQGRRTDLEALKDDIISGKTTVDEIIINNPVIFHQYGRTLEKIEDIKMSKLSRTEMTKGIWLYGDTGCGKSHKAFEGFSPETHYNLPNDNGWWDNYRQQETVVINDFRGHIKYDELLQMVDKWPYQVPRRGRTPLPFTSKKVIITSPLRPEEVYCNRNEKDNIAQLYRRFDIIEVKREIKDMM